VQHWNFWCLLITLTTTTPYYGLLLGRKRRASEDEEMTIADVLVDHPSNQPILSASPTATAGATLLDRRHLETGRFTKRNRATIHKQFPISKLLGKS
jgi:hypothetical protein